MRQKCVKTEYETKISRGYGDYLGREGWGWIDGGRGCGSGVGRVQ